MKSVRAVDVLASWLIFGCLGGTLKAATSDSIAFNPDVWRSVTFAKIPPTSYDLRGAVLEAKVDKSSSLLVAAWDKPRRVRAIAFEWKTQGKLLTANADVEKSKKGDDAALKVALLLHGPAPFIPFFAPSWIKAVASLLKYPTDRALNITVTKHVPEGTKWESPYTSSIEHVAVAGTLKADDWRQAQYQLPQPTEAVGLWLMADGDDTASVFTTSVRELKVTYDN